MTHDVLLWINKVLIIFGQNLMIETVEFYFSSSKNVSKSWSNFIGQIIRYKDYSIFIYRNWLDHWTENFKLRTIVF